MIVAAMNCFRFLSLAGWLCVAATSLGAAGEVVSPYPRGRGQGEGGGAAGSATQAAPDAVQRGDWPQYGGTLQRNMVSAEPLVDSFAVKFKDYWTPLRKEHRNVRWLNTLGSETYGGVTIANGKVVVCYAAWKPKTAGVVACLEEATGRSLWQLKIQHVEMKRNTQNYLGICSSATLEGDRAYTVSNRNEVLCLDMRGMADGNTGPFVDEAAYLPGDGPAEGFEVNEQCGDIIWRFSVTEKLGIYPHDTYACSPLILGNLVYVNSGLSLYRHERCETPEAPSLLALDKDTGNLVATDDQRMAGINGDRLAHGNWCNPAIGWVNGRAQLLFGGPDAVCYAFDPQPQDGKLRKLWSFDCVPRGKRRVGGNHFLGNPVCVNNKVYFALGQDWTHGSGPAFMACVDATGAGDVTQTGLVWRYDGINRSQATVSVADGLVYATDIAGQVHCVDAETGKPCWVFDTKAPLWSPTLVANGHVYACNSKGWFFILKHGKELEVQASDIRLMSRMCGAMSAANGVLYVPTYRFLYAIGPAP